MHPRAVIVRRRFGVLVLSLTLVACAAQPSSVPTATAPAPLPPLSPAKAAPSSRDPLAPLPSVQSASSLGGDVGVAEHWYFEALSHDGKRALLRQLEPGSRTTFHVRVVDVDSGHIVDETRLPELAKIPSSTIGGKQTELTELEWMLASPAFGRDLVKGARIAGAFPFGACGRLAAAANGSAIAFDAGDWLYTADASGRVRRRLVDEAAYDPRFSADGKHFLFRRATGKGDLFTKYELFTMPADLSSPPRVIPGSAGVRDRFFAHPDGQSAIAIATQTRVNATANANAHVAKGSTDTCVLSLSLKPPFLVKRLACLDGGEQLVETVVSPRGKWAALSTKKRVENATVVPAPRDAPTYDGRTSALGSGNSHLEWRLRVLSLTTGKVVRDEPDMPGLGIRAISDSGLLVQSGALGILVTDVPSKKWRAIESQQPIDLGYRGFFRNDKELVYVVDGGVGLIDVSKD